jgi:hypothetical protein
MRNILIVGGFVVATLVPSFAAAQASCEQQQSSRLTNTVAGAGIGALIGGVVAGRDDRGKGAVIGGIGGALLGSQVGKAKTDCARAYGYYDNNGLWHANAVDRSAAAGYFDREGRWVDGQPNGYYDAQGHWVRTEGSASGYYANGRWVPASATGYYDADGRLVAGAASGHYDTRGRWIAGPTTGRYDAKGRWIPGQASGRRDQNGAWVADAQPGYYSNGRWVAGPAVGYYDGQGRWIPTRADRAHPSNASYPSSSGWRDAPAGLDDRQAWLEQKIRRGMSDGMLGRDEGARGLRSLDEISRDEQRLRRNGRFGARRERELLARVDDVNDSLRWDRNGGSRPD